MSRGIEAASFLNGSRRHASSWLLPRMMLRGFPMCKAEMRTCTGISFIDSTSLHASDRQQQQWSQRIATIDRGRTSSQLIPLSEDVLPLSIE